MISFIVPAYNEELELPATLAAIHDAAKAGGQPYEIVVVDDASTDATASISEKKGASVTSVHHRQIAAVRNSGAKAARGDIFFFVDADTRIFPAHVTKALAALEAGKIGGGAWVRFDGEVPLWAGVFSKIFMRIYYAMNLGAGSFLFTRRESFEAIGGFDEQFFAGEEMYFSHALKKLGRFVILRDEVVTSGRKMRFYTAREFFPKLMGILLGGENALRSRDKLDIWYSGRREDKSA
jgi:glycosyltransferase involved in cell wall biosynthesis